MRQRQKQRKHESNDPIYRMIIAVFLVMGGGTFLHDPVLHGAVAMVYGWQISDYQTGLMIGSTSVITPVNAAWWQYWIFFMTPALAIFLVVAVITFIVPEKEVMVGGIILMALNLPSLNPAITGSDAYNTVEMLVKMGFNEGFTNIMHYLLFFAVLLIWALYLYVTIENSASDARSRIENIYH